MVINVSIAVAVMQIENVDILNANASRARQFNPLNPPGVGWVNFFIYFLR